jgi:Ca-activated chloride channel family protein
VDEARKVFGEQADGTLEVIAKDVKLQVEFNPEAVASYRLVGYENRDIADKDFRNDAVDAGEIGAGHAVTAFYEVTLTGAPATALAHVRVRAKQPDGEQAREQIFSFATSEIHGELHEASAGFQFGAAVVAFAEKLRKSPHTEKMTWGLIEELASANATGERRVELLELVRAASGLEQDGFSDELY